MVVKTHRKRESKNKKNKTKKRVFSKKDYVSGDGMMTKIWGPPTWFMLHTISFNYPNNPTSEDKIYYKKFILNLTNILPCKYCRINLKNNLKKMPLTMEHLKNRESFSRFVYELHEMVNKMLNKKSGLSYTDVRERFEHFRSRCTEEYPRVFQFEKIMETNKGKDKEKGCTEPLYGKKSKCILNIVPLEDRSATLKINKECIKRRDIVS
jgi:hypothetical protein